MRIRIINKVAFTLTLLIGIMSASSIIVYAGEDRTPEASTSGRHSASNSLAITDINELDMNEETLLRAYLGFWDESVIEYEYAYITKWNSASNKIEYWFETNWQYKGIEILGNVYKYPSNKANKIPSGQAIALKFEDNERVYLLYKCYSLEHTKMCLAIDIINKNTDIILYSIVLENKEKHGSVVQSIIDAYYGIEPKLKRELIYTVKNGDTLWSISNRVYGSGEKYTEILESNNISDASLITPGQKIKIPLN